jgi:arsenite/tail-anchored protein-transporting ATPase
MDSAAARTSLALGSRRILFVGGKGGVGKSTVASAMALRLSEKGERCLLVSTDPAHSLGDIWDCRIGDTEKRLGENLWGTEIDPDVQVARHLESVTRTMREFARLDLHPEIERQMKLARMSPGAVEAAMLERMADTMITSADRFDRIVFDTAPTGHTLRLLSLPEIMAAWTDGLLRHRDRSEAWDTALEKLRPRRPPGDDLSFVERPEPATDVRSQRIRSLLLDRRRKFTQARRLLLDPETTGFLLVLIPEKLPILESRKAVDALVEFHVPIAGVVVNRVLPEEDLGIFLEHRRDQESIYLDRIDELFPGLDQVRVPLLPNDVVGMEGLRHVAGFLIP